MACRACVVLGDDGGLDLLHVGDKLVELYQHPEHGEVLQFPEEVAVLVRTNDVIKKLEIKLLKRKIPIRYNNYFTAADIKAFHAGEIGQGLKIKLNMF